MTQLSLLEEPQTCSCCGQPARPRRCASCRQGQHVDHHQGVWDYANPELRGDPVICPCKGECQR